jgi:enamine deaminase RidA (YjgF/YER057c/UK114 family)
MRIIKPEKWPRPSGFADGIAATGEAIFISGQVGWDPVSHQFESADFAGQVAQALRNVVAVAAAGGAQPEHIVRMTWFITDKPAYQQSKKRIGKAYREIMGSHYPAMSVVCVAALVEDQAKVEIEATAVVPR